MYRSWRPATAVGREVVIRVIHVANDVQMEDPRHNALLADLD